MTKLSAEELLHRFIADNQEDFFEQAVDAYELMPSNNASVLKFPYKVQVADVCMMR
jgi:hypothetical protein